MEKFKTLTMCLPDCSYDITIGYGALSKVSELFMLDRRVLIVTDDGVPREYVNVVEKAALHPFTVTIPQGEENKSFASLERLCREMLAQGFTRRDCVVAVGGGIVGDLGGFAAACYMRGIDFYNIPTTLLSQVDSSIGGKTAVNLCGIKNPIGAFHQPKGVLIDPGVLATLPKRQIASGLAESLKMSMTHDPALFALFEEGKAEERLLDVIEASLKIKKSVVEADEKESGLRKVLNFGHTVGHGIESVAGVDVSRDAEGGLYHGECVALGMIPMCTESVKKRLLPILASLALPTKTEIAPEKITAAMRHDKKAGADTVTAVTVNEIGQFRFEKMTFEALESKVRLAFEK